MNKRSATPAGAPTGWLGRLRGLPLPAPIERLLGAAPLAPLQSAELAFTEQRYSDAVAAFKTLAAEGHTLAYP